VLSSDEPHPEGGSDARAACDSELADSGIPAEVHQAFFGGTMAADLAQTA